VTDVGVRLRYASAHEAAGVVEALQALYGRSAIVDAVCYRADTGSRWEGA